jgi:tyrosine-protein kinase Etk/Wzc
MKPIDTNLGSQNPKANEVEEEEDGSFLSDLDFIKLLIVAKENLLYIFLFFASAIALAYTYNRYSHAIYESSSVIKLDQPKQEGFTIGNSSAPVDNNLLPGEIELIQSKLIHERALSILKFDITYFKKGNINSEELYKSSPFNVTYLIKNAELYNQNFDLKVKNSKEYILSYSFAGQEYEIPAFFGQKIENNHFVFLIQKVNLLSDNLEGNYSFVINNQDALLSYISQNLLVTVINPSANTLQISFKDHCPEKARDIILAIDSVYKVESLKKKYQAQEQTIDFLNDQLRLTEKNLEEYEHKLENFTIKNKTTDVKEKVGQVLTTAEELKIKLVELKTQMGLLDQLKDLMLKNENLKQHLPTLSALPDPQIAMGIASLNKLQQDKEKLLTTSRPTTFAVKNKDIEIEGVRNALLELIMQNKKLLYESIVDVNNKIVEEEGEFLTLPSKGTELTRLNRFYELYEKYYLMMIDKKAEYEMTKAGAVAEFIVLSQPVAAKVPIAPKKITAYIIAGALGLVLSLAFVFFKYLTHNTINNIGELERITVAPVLGFIPLLDKVMDVSRLVVDKNPKSPVIEALRSIRTNLEFLSSEKKNRLISVTSTVSGEGKTFVAINLGGVIAYSGTKVIIIDLDMRKPKINVGFGVENDKGASTILIGKHRVEECIHRSTIDTLDFITSGPTPPNPSELILRPEFDQMLEYLKTRYDVVILDTPPVGLVTDGILVMRKVDLPVYVVRAQVSKKGYEKNINRLVKLHGFKSLSVVLNAFSNTLGGYGYGYQYGYGYGYGYYSEQEKEEEGFFSKVIDFIKRKK